MSPLLSACGLRRRSTALLFSALLISAAAVVSALPPSKAVAHAVPAPPIVPSLLRVEPSFADGTQFSGSRDLGNPGSWRLGDSLYPSVTAYTATFSVGTFTGIGPAPILSGQTQGNGAPVSGRVSALAADPTNAATFYVGAAGGGVWKTTNGGASYTPLTDSLPDLAMGALAVDPTNPSVIYAGTGEANNSLDSRYGVGLYKSTDGGGTWTLYNGPGGAFNRNAISRIVIDPSNTQTVYLTTGNSENGGYGNWGVWKSTDGGKTWAYSFANDPNRSTIFSDLAIDPSNTQTLYAAAGYIFGSAANGIYKSTDGGSTWTLLTGFPNGAQSGNDVGRIVLALAPSNPQILYASYSSHGANGAAFGALAGFYTTTNGGGTWTALSSAPNYLGGQGWYDNALIVSPTNPAQVFAAGTGQYADMVSSDSGSTWTTITYDSSYNGPHTDHHALAFTASGSLLDGSDGGVWRMDQPGTSSFSWNDVNTNLETIQFTGLALDPSDPNIAYGGSQDNGTEKYTGSTTWNLIRYGDGGFVRVDQSNPLTVYHEYYDLSLERSDDGGNSWTGATNGITGAKVVDDSDVSGNFYEPYVLDPANQSRIILGTDRVNESTDKGADFHALSVPNTNGFNPNDYNIDSLGVNGSTIYVSAGGTVYVTTNNGSTWTALSIPGDTDNQSDIWVNPANSLDVIVVRGRFNGGSGGHLFRTGNGGASWTDISGNLPDEPFNAVKLDTVGNVLYAGGDDGVYESVNGGASWTKPAMPNAQVTDLALSPGANLVGAATHGRGIFEAVLSTAPGTPSRLTAAAAYSQIVLNWMAPASTGATYSIYRGTTAGGENATPIATGVTATTYTDSAVVIGVTYYYTVKMVVGGSAGGASNEASATAISGPPTLYVPTNAYPTIQSAINAASAGYYVQVADGTYTGPGNVDLSFGGKSITVTSTHGAGSTIIDCGGTSSAPHRGFIFSSQETPNAVVNGFTIQNAYGSNQGAIYAGDGTSPTITNCVLRNNTSAGGGAGMFNYGKPTLTNCTFSGNTTVAGSGGPGGTQGGDPSGAGIYSYGTLTLQNCTFSGNQAFSNGGAVDIRSGSSTMTNCVFTGNTTGNGSGGGAIMNYATLTLVNCTSTHNTASYGALGLYSGSTTTLTNDIFYQDSGGEIAGAIPAASDCDIQGGVTGTGNINSDPLFVSSPSDLHLGTGSPCLGAGTSTGAPTTTIDGRTRPTPPSIGAYEGVPVATTVTVAGVSGTTGQSVTLSATLTATSGGGLSGKTLAFSVDGAAVGTAVTGSSGTATLPYVIPSNDSSGSHTISVMFAGDSGDTASSGTNTLTVSAPPPSGQVRYFPRSGYPSRMVGGAFQGSHDNSTWTTLATVTQTPPANAYSTLPTSADPATFRYLRYLAPNGSYGNVAEIEFDSSGKKLTGLGFGTAGSYNNDGLSFGNALDGSTSTYFDAPAPGNGDYVGIDQNGTAPNQVRFYPRSGYPSRMVGGLFQGSANNSTWTTLATVTQTPLANAYSTLPTSADPATFRYLRYLAPNGSYGDVAEIEFDSKGVKLTGTRFGTPGSYNNNGTTYQNALDGSTSTYFDAPAPGNGDFVGIDQGTTPPTYTKLTGTAFGTSGSYNNDGDTYLNAFDGNLGTYVDAPSPGNGDYDGIDSGTGHTAVVTRIGYCPRSGYPSRMVGGVFQGSNDNAAWTALYTVTAAPASGVLTQTTAISSGTAYRYLRYLAPTGSYGNVAEVEFDTSP